MKKQINVEQLKEILPHGSGIDSDWEFEEHKNGNVTCKNYFHVMNEWGGYDGYMPFKFTLYLNKENKIDFNKLICNENKRISYYGLKFYLEETIICALESYSVEKETKCLKKYIRIKQ